MIVRRHLSPDLDVSNIAYGMWRLLDDPDHSAAHLQAKIEACLELGMTTFDQADIYGGYAAEAELGKTLRAAPHLRERMEIITKCGIVAPMGRYDGHRVKHYNTSAHHITQSVETSLKLMNVDYIDVLLIHRPDPFMDHKETAGALDGLIDSGKVRGVGVSNFKPYDTALLASAMAHPIITNQIEISLIHNAPFSNGDVASLQQGGITPMAWSPLGGGQLFQSSRKELLARLEAIGAAHGVKPATIAIAWLLAHPSHIIPVIGTNSIPRIQDAAKAAEISMDRETWFELLELANGYEVA